MRKIITSTSNLNLNITFATKRLDEFWHIDSSPGEMVFITNVEELSFCLLLPKCSTTKIYWYIFLSLTNYVPHTGHSPSRPLDDFPSCSFFTKEDGIWGTIDLCTSFLFFILRSKNCCDCQNMKKKKTRNVKLRTKVDGNEVSMPQIGFWKGNC